MSSALERVFQTAGCRTQQQLAEFLGISQSSISDAKRREVIPAEWLLKLLRDRGVNPDWILTGEGVHYLRSAESPAGTVFSAGTGQRAGASGVGGTDGMRNIVMCY